MSSSKLSPELDLIRNILSNPKTAELAKRMDKVNPQQTGSDLFEV